MAMARRIAAVTSAALVVVVTGALTPPATAQNRWQGYQTDVSYTVYKPYKTFGMERTKLTINTACSPAVVPLLVQTVHAAYRGSGGKLIKLYETDASLDCIPPGGGAMVQYEPARTFAVQDGAGTATLWMDCRTALQCEFPSNELIKTLGAWVKVPLQAESPKFGTHAYVYTKNLSYKKIKQFVWSLGLP
jgi:hypothetical protein